MRIPALLPILLTTLPLPAEVMATEAHIAVVEFPLTADPLIGERVTLDDCHLVFATENEATCLGLAQQAGPAAGTAPSLRRVLIRLAESAAARRRPDGLCEGGALDDACHVSVSGVVEDQSDAFGLADRPMLGLRESTILWPD